MRLVFVLGIGCNASPSGPPPCTPATPANILTVRGDYYVCLDAALNAGLGCGPQGYPIGFAHKYAERYLTEVYADRSDDGKAFLEAVSICLQQEIQAAVSVDMPCEVVAELGFGTHPGCYVASGFCALALTDTFPIAGAVDAQDQALEAVRESADAVAEACNAAT